MFLNAGNDPGNQNGASVILVDQAGNLTFEFELDEQGTYQSIVDNGNVIVPGIDPYEEWTLGNLYVRDGLGVWEKIRNIPNVIHTFGICVHVNGDLYIATGSHIGDQQTLQGKIFRSSDLGQSWDSGVIISTYRAYDIISFSGNLYITTSDYLFGESPRRVQFSIDNGYTWNFLSNITVSTLPRMVIWQNKIVVITATNGFYTIDVNNDISVFPNPPRLITKRFNPMAVVGGDLYVLCEDKVYKTDDLTVWERYCDVPANSISLMSWPGFGLIVSTSGANAQLLRIPFV